MSTQQSAESGAPVVLGQIGEHVDPQACRECGKSASACGRSYMFCCAACSRSRFETHDPSVTSPAKKCTGCGRPLIDKGLLTCETDGCAGNLARFTSPTDGGAS